MDEAERKATLKRVYGRGYFDGLRASKRPLSEPGDVEALLDLEERTRAALSLLAWLMRQSDFAIHLRDILRLGPSLTREAPQRNAALELLTDMGLVRVEFEPAHEAGGRPSPFVFVNLSKDHYMNKAKYESVMRNLSPLAKKIYDAMPTDQPLTFSQIAAVLAKSGHKPPAINILSGAVSSMAEAGLLKEKPHGLFTRPETKQSEAPQVSSEAQNTGDTNTRPDETPTEPLSPVGQHGDPLEDLATLGQHLRAFAKTLEETSGLLLKHTRLAATFASKVDALALESEERIQKVHADTAKLRQLQELLKAIQA